MQDGPSNRFALARVFVLAMLSASGLNAADREGGPTRLTPSEIHWPATGGNEAPGSSMRTRQCAPFRRHGIRRCHRRMYFDRAGTTFVRPSDDPRRGG
jgi:hypothetical protein